MDIRTCLCPRSIIHVLCKDFQLLVMEQAPQSISTHIIPLACQSTYQFCSQERIASCAAYLRLSGCAIMPMQHATTGNVQCAAAISGERCSLLVLELDWLAPILWEQHLLPLFDVHRNNLSILQVSPTWASGNYQAFAHLQRRQTLELERWP